MSEPDQQALIGRAQAGSAEAFTLLVTLHQDRLYRFLLSRCHARADAEDALQEAFISAFRYLDSYSSRWEFSTWLYRIALRELGKIRRRSAGSPEVTVPADERDEDPLAACIAASQKENLWLTARAALSDQAYTALWLRYAEDMPVSDVARVMGRPAVWVRVTVHRARRRLARVMIDDERASGTGSGALSRAGADGAAQRADPRRTGHEISERAIEEQPPGEMGKIAVRTGERDGQH